MPQDVTTIANFTRLEEAVVARTVLESAGIECFLADENMMHIAGPHGLILGGVRLQVLDSEAEAARELLRTLVPADSEQEGPAE